MRFLKRLRSVSVTPGGPNRPENDNANFNQHLQTLNREDLSVLTRMVLEENKRAANDDDSCPPQTVHPPDYKVLAPLFPRYPIVPREEEGREPLPAYISSIRRESLAMRKPEFSSPYLPAAHRSWSSVYMSLNNTKLTLHKISRKSLSWDQYGKKEKTFNVLRSYTLQYAQVGLALDYQKRPNVLRLRVENEQILVAFSCQEECIGWCHDLQIAIDLSLPIEERDLPTYRSIPAGRRRRRRRSEISTSDLSLRPSMSARSLVSGGIRSIPGDAPAIGTANTPISTPDRTKRLTFEEPRRRPVSYIDTVNQSRTSLNPFISGTSAILDRLATNDEEAVSDMEDDEDVDGPENSIAPISTRTTTSSTFTSFYKWNPVRHIHSRSSFLRYATRCLSTLTADIPWIDRPIVVEGRKYIVRENKYEPVSTIV